MIYEGLLRELPGVDDVAAITMDAWIAGPDVVGASPNPVLQKTAVFARDSVGTIYAHT